MDNHDLRIYPLPLYLKRIQEMKHRQRRPQHDKLREFFSVMLVWAIVVVALVWGFAKGL